MSIAEIYRRKWKSDAACRKQSGLNCCIYELKALKSWMWPSIILKLYPVLSFILQIRNYIYFLTCFISADQQHICKPYGWYKHNLTQTLVASVCNCQFADNKMLWSRYMILHDPWYLKVINQQTFITEWTLYMMITWISRCSSLDIQEVEDAT